MRKLLIYFLTLTVFMSNFNAAIAANKSKKKKAQVITYRLQTDSFEESQEANIDEGKIYLRVSKRDLKELRRQALLSASLLQRIRDLEKLYKNVNNIVNTIVGAITLIKKFVNFDDLDLDFSGTNDDFEHISGVIMSPGFVEFEATVAEEDLNFDDIDNRNLFMDIYFNRNLFTIDHIEGDGVLGVEAKNITLPKKNAASKARIELPVSDVLASSVKFKVFLAPLNPDLIKVGHKTSLNIKYYKRVAENDDGERIPPVDYGFVEGSSREIVVKVK
jgi:hypothetical protein